MRDVNKNYKTELIKLLKSYKNCFASTNEEIGCTNLGEMRIKINTSKPIVRKAYRLAHTERQVVSKLV